MVTVSGGALAIDSFVSTFILENIFFGGPAFPGLDVSQQPLVQNSWGLRVNPGRQFFFFLLNQGAWRSSYLSVTSVLPFLSPTSFRKVILSYPVFSLEFTGAFMF